MVPVRQAQKQAQKQVARRQGRKLIRLRWQRKRQLQPRLLQGQVAQKQVARRQGRNLIRRRSQRKKQLQPRLLPLYLGALKIQQHPRKSAAKPS
mmetsp:Transcript_25750/g.60755  ORF Transcript_25750/g.60755 Transcript_25750/m.60755 type:complete len:94 (+) Transcript_25750:453-734(+)